jgi:UDP-N-acetylmuramoyl-L-alanyl-D-glutamate--2,6-diaminopimelate ligase
MWQGLKNVYHLGVAVLANIWFGFPSRRLKVIGVTGTDGKTTTTNLIYHILDAAGLKVSMITSVGALIGGRNYDIGFHVTTPSSFGLQRFIKKIVDSGSEYLVLETTSHALDQHRVFGIKFDIGVLTNITHEHLDYHKTYENYVATKARLLKSAKIAIVNRDDESFKLLSSKFNPPVGGQSSKFNPPVGGQSSKFNTYGLRDNSELNTETFPFKTNLIGEFNKYNILAAVGVCKSIGIKDQIIRRAIASFKPPAGRGEIVFSSAGSGQADFTVMIDFAHTPNSFDQILSSIKPEVRGRIIHVFGSAGLRDRKKRPLMGNISSKYADVIILTAEDPRTEKISKINNDIFSGIKNYELRIMNKTLFTIEDRKKAIKAAINMTKNGDFVLITGKAHEKSMNYGQGEVPWDEFEVVKKAINEKK